MTNDDRIDIIARDMTNAEPRVDFRARVLASLPDRRPHRWARVLLPAAVAIIIGATSWFAGRFSHPTALPLPLTRAAAQAPGGAAPGSGAVDAPAPSVQRHRHVSAPTAEDLAWQARAVPRLPRADTLTIAPIQPNALSIAPITVLPVAPPDPIALGAVDSRAGGRYH
jgi:hypothetical protein